MYRLASNAIWHSLPGVVAAYLPIGAPNPFAALQNVAHGGKRFGVYTATSAALPTWSAATGSTFNGTTQYLTTVPSGVASTWTTLIRFSSWISSAAQHVLYGCAGDPGTGKYAIYWYMYGTTARFVNGSYLSYARGSQTAAVVGIGGNIASVNGTQIGTIATSTEPTGALQIGYRYTDWGAFTYQSFLCCSRTLSPAEIWLASRQMAYCEKNPDWNAWARRRMYFYAPSAAFQAAWAARQNRLIGGGSS